MAVACLVKTTVKTNPPHLRVIPAEG
jgi:hypothetical protein